ncbi:MAG: site-2 protease family protein, partial [Phenylobacterium sp.]
MADLRFTGWTSPVKVFGVQVRVHLSWLIVALLIAWSLASGSLPMIYAGLPRGAYWAMAAMIIVGLGLSIVLHEIAHTLAGRAMGVSVDRVTLFLLGGVAELHEEPKAPGAELVMALAGPAFSILFGVFLAFATTWAADAGAPETVVGGIGYLATLNIVLAGFNLLPAFPLDGGRVVRALVWMVSRDLERATRLAAAIGQGF